ncbi:SecY-interacting protein [Shewanella sp. UCD-KL12]|uniref:SecY-interacting protein n=1 Tax=Shewanella sp. UCD-KL12 TaxID=1917163 RepID=UPI000970EA40|nr:SecY-interacting protein [Shewanella sp. UCD-KL12]
MSSLPALDNLLKIYHQAYMDKLGESPRYYPRGENSDCIEGDYADKVNSDDNDDLLVFWKPVKRAEVGSFENVESALELKLQVDINEFYGAHFSAPLLFDSQWGEGELLQAWSLTDFEYLQQNIIGHLMMKKKLKQPPTWFIGVLGNGEQMLTVDNSDGSVWIEIPGEEQSEKLSDNLNDFIKQVSPRVAPPELHVEEPMPKLDHPGIWNRIKVMWNNLKRS